MILPCIWLFGAKGWYWDIILLWWWSRVMGKSLTWSHLNCAVVSVWFSLYGLGLSHRRYQCVWSFRRVVVSLEMGCFCHYTLFFYWFCSGSLNLRFRFRFRLNLLFGSLYFVSVEFRDWLFFLLSWSTSNSSWRFSLSYWRFHCSLSFETFNNFLKGESGFLNVHFEFESELIWDFDFLLKSVSGVFSEFLDIIGWIDIDTS